MHLKYHLVALAAAVTLSTGAGAQTVNDTSLQNVNGLFGSSLATTTTTPTGTRTTVVGAAGGAANRASATPVLNSWFQANVGAGSTVGITTDYARSGNGSAYFNSLMGENGKADLIYHLGTGGSLASVPLASLTGAAFDFYRDAASTTGAQYAPVLRLDMAKDGKAAGSLVLETIYQHQTNPATNSWTALSSTLDSGIWWATSAALGPTFATGADGQKTLAQWISGNSGSTLSVYGLEIGIGSGWNGSFYGAVDNVNVAFSSGRTVTANFEVASAAAVPEPASWATMMLGAGGIGVMLRRRRTKGVLAAA